MRNWKLSAGIALARAARELWTRWSNRDDEAARLQQRIRRVLDRRPFAELTAVRRTARRRRAIAGGAGAAAGLVALLIFGFAWLLTGLDLGPIPSLLAGLAATVAIFGLAGGFVAWQATRNIEALRAEPGWRVVALADDIDRYLVDHAPEIRAAAPADRQRLLGEVSHLVEGLEQVAAGELAELATTRPAAAIAPERVQRLQARVGDALADQSARRVLREELE